MRECQLCKHCFTDEVATCPKDGMPTAHTINGEPVLEGKYHLELRLGQGGMGVVYKARHAYLKTYHAIKIILPDLVGNDPQLVTRFRQEALAAAAIRHQNVVAVTDYGVIQGSIPFLVMEYVEGESLHDLLARETRLSPETAFELISAVCAGVGAAHHQGIVHRDLKPLNIMICKDKPSISQAVKILDFGLAKIKSGELLGSFIQAQTTGLMGSPYYMAPEQWSDDDPDARSDIYSLGVILFQMLTGDVPFKGSSIPAIMKKHISDPLPTFAELGIEIAPEIEVAVQHTLQKDPNNRTPTVEVMVDELRAAIHPMGIGVNTAGGITSLPVSSLNIRTQPPKSKVFVDNVPVGQTREDGWITLNGIQSGNHHVRISHDGFEDWLGDVVCDGRPQMVEAALRARGSAAAPVVQATPTAASTLTAVPATTGGFAKTSGEIDDGDQTILQNLDTGSPSIFTVTEEPKRRALSSPFAIAMIAVIVLLGLAGGAVAGAYLLGLFESERPAAKSVNAGPRPTAAAMSPAAPAIKADMVAIPGGTFKMGRDEGRENERPEHDVTVRPFFMDRTEVTNAEYLEFVTETGRRPLPAHWVNEKPIPGQEQMPVRFVTYDDAMAFAEWRSKRDGTTYRLPTEQEWEFAARNGSKANLYPWGDKYDSKCAVLEESSHEPKAVGSKSCPNEWGAVDLIGNVFEWTSSPPALYPGSPGSLKPLSESYYMVRGGSAFYKSAGPLAITSTFRQEVPAKKSLAELGFRLVRSQ